MKHESKYGGFAQLCFALVWEGRFCLGLVQDSINYAYLALAQPSRWDSMEAHATEECSHGDRYTRVALWNHGYRDDVRGVRRSDVETTLGASCVCTNQAQLVFSTGKFKEAGTMKPPSKIYRYDFVDASFGPAFTLVRGARPSPKVDCDDGASCAAVSCLVNDYWPGGNIVDAGLRSTCYNTIEFPSDTSIADLGDDFA